MSLSYAQFLGLFLIPPIIILALLQRHKLRSAQVAYVGLMAIVAFLYTPIWDNYLVANRVWWYDPDLVWGITLFWVPLEEYLFFILQPIMVGLWILWLHERLPARGAKSVNKPALRWLGVGGLSIIWVLSLIALLFGAESLTYGSLILVWALPPVMLQLGYGADILFNRGRLVIAVLASASLYLCLADALAIHIGIWTISPDQTIGLYLWGVLPFEEALFFFLTNVLLTFGIVLYLEPTSHERLMQLRAWIAAKRAGSDPQGQTR